MNKRLLVGTRKGLFTLLRSGSPESPWTIHSVDFLADNVSMVLADPRDGTLLAALDHGHFGVKMHRALRGGAWTECEAPAYPPKPEDVVDNDPWGKPIPWSTVRVWALSPGGTDKPGVVWCGTIPGGLFRSADSGATWELNRPLWDHPGRREWMGGGADLPGLHSIAVDPRNSNCIRVGVSCGGMWQTDDGGATWACRADGMRATYMPPERAFDPGIQDPHAIVQCREAPDWLWTQHHNGIFLSTDGGAKWSEIENVEPSNFGFAVAVHPKDPKTAWFVPGISDEKRLPPNGAIVVTRTRDGGRSFEVLNRGLPQVHAYDIVYRHALAIDDRGETLAFGSTTGGFWVSDDQGDSWQCISTTLPPVYCVGFAPD
jgi:photosystem II stability/assembly factor-like uncharacterized protein